MHIYENKHYRKIYETHFGPIPRDLQGRSYEIHHIDGDHSNNTIDNFKLVTIEEHYAIHRDQEDWAACLIISHRMKLSPEEKSKLGRLNAVKQIAQGKNKFTDPEFNRQNQLRRVADGTHHMLGGKIQSETQKRLSASGKHNFSGPDTIKKLLAEGKHVSQRRVSCVHCKKETNFTTFLRIHNGKCK